MDDKKNIKHILLIRTSAMGDVAMTVPVVDALRRRYPDLRITVLTRAFFKPFFRAIPNVEFLEFDPKVRHKGIAGLLRLSAEIRRLNVDAVVDLHDVVRSKLIRLSLIGTPVRKSVIDKGRYEKRMLVRRRKKHLKQLKTSVERYRDAIAKIGLDLTLPPAYERQSQKMPASIKCRSGEKKGVWIGVAPFAQHRGKIYPVVRMEAFIRAMNERYHKVFLFGGGAQEQSFAEAMEHDFGNVVSVIGRVSLAEEMDVMSNLDVMVTMDSSSMHIASVVGVPVVSVWGATHPAAGFYGFGQNPDNAVQLEFPCRPCSVYGNKECFFGDYRCMERIEPEVIADKVEDFIKRQKEKTQAKLYNTKSLFDF